MGAKVGNIGGGMVELATIAMNTTYTGNEPWVARIKEFDMIYVESDYNDGGGTNYGVGTEIYSSAIFKKLLDEGKTMSQYTGNVNILYQTLSSNKLRSVKLSGSVFTGSNVSSIKIYGIK